MRLTAEAEPEQVITPKWWMSKGQFLAFFHEKFLHPEQDGAFESVTTADGSPTLYHPGFRQHFHTLAGAATEAERKFVIPSRLRERLAAGKPVRVLDVGFGLGVNCAAALRCGGPLEIITLGKRSARPRRGPAALSGGSLRAPADRRAGFRKRFRGERLPGRTDSRRCARCGRDVRTAELRRDFPGRFFAGLPIRSSGATISCAPWPAP